MALCFCDTLLNRTSFFTSGRATTRGILDCWAGQWTYLYSLMGPWAGLDSIRSAHWPPPMCTNALGLGKYIHEAHRYTRHPSTMSLRGSTISRRSVCEDTAPMSVMKGQPSPPAYPSAQKIPHRLSLQQLEGAIIFSPTQRDAHGPSADCLVCRFQLTRRARAFDFARAAHSGSPRP